MTGYVEADQLEAGLPHILDSPSVLGTVELVVRRPAEGEREVLEEGVLDVEHGLVGDRWRPRSSSDGRRRKTRADDAHERQGDRPRRRSSRRWPLAGDQLYVDLDLRHENLPPGTRLSGLGDPEVTDLPHTGCAKFTARFGSGATQFVNGSRPAPSFAG